MVVAITVILIIITVINEMVVAITVIFNLVI